MHPQTSNDDKFLSRLGEISPAHPIPAGAQITYGTSGFRTHASKLDGVLFRVGLFAALRSQKLGGKWIGVMITASHNPAPDNGVKLVEPDGNMLPLEWETYVTELANTTSSEEAAAAVERLATAQGIGRSLPARVVYGHDTRPSSPSLVQALKDGLSCMGNVEEHAAGLVTTPQLHYLVRCINEVGQPDAYGVPSETGYYEKLSKAFGVLNPSPEHLGEIDLTIDCSNGVGAPKLKALSKHLALTNFKVHMFGDNTTTPEALNQGCGADYVKVNQKPPVGLTMRPNARYCSLDGDADRLVYYYQTSDDQFKLLDGDKIATLAAAFLVEVCASAGIKVNLGVVQTAYANGSSSRYLEEVLRVPIATTPTGVKHLHHTAANYDIGVYFEANGHGTVLFSPDFIVRVRASKAANEEQEQGRKKLLALHDLINQTVGDALSDMLLVETILLHKGWNAEDWDQAYTDLPNRLEKVIVSDRNTFTTTDAERRLTAPAGLQGKIDDAMKKYSKGRSFVRPSGTEDCVRVYAEAGTQFDADNLAKAVAGLVRETASS